MAAPDLFVDGELSGSGCCDCARSVNREAGQRQSSCPFHKHREIAEKFSVRAEVESELDGTLGNSASCSNSDRYAIVGELRVAQLIDAARRAARPDAGRSPT